MNESIYDFDLFGEVPEWTRILYFIFLGLVNVIGVSGNLLVAIVYWRTNPKTACDWLILTMALSDFLVCFLSPWFYFRSEYPLPTPPFIICGVELWLVLSAMVASCVILDITALDRYIKMCKPKWQSLSPRRAQIASLACLIISAAFGAPTIAEMEEQPKDSCRFADKFFTMTYTKIYLYMVSAIFSLSFVLVTFAYGCVCKQIIKKVKVKKRLIERANINKDRPKHRDKSICIRFFSMVCSLCTGTKSSSHVQSGNGIRESINFEKTSLRPMVVPLCRSDVNSEVGNFQDQADENVVLLETININSDTATKDADICHSQTSNRNSGTDMSHESYEGTDMASTQICRSIDQSLSHEDLSQPMPGPPTTNVNIESQSDHHVYYLHMLPGNENEEKVSASPSSNMYSGNKNGSHASVISSTKTGLWTFPMNPNNNNSLLEPTINESGCSSPTMNSSIESSLPPSTNANESSYSLPIIMNSSNKCGSPAARLDSSNKTFVAPVASSRKESSPFTIDQTCYRSLCTKTIEPFMNSSNGPDQRLKAECSLFNIHSKTDYDRSSEIADTFDTRVNGIDVSQSKTILLDFHELNSSLPVQARDAVRSDELGNAHVQDGPVIAENRSMGYCGQNQNTSTSNVISPCQREAFYPATKLIITPPTPVTTAPPIKTFITSVSQSKSTTHVSKSNLLSCRSASVDKEETNALFLEDDVTDGGSHKHGSRKWWRRLSPSKSLYNKQFKREKQITLMLLSATLIFLLAWIPPLLFYLLIISRVPVFAHNVTLARVAFRHLDRMHLIHFVATPLIYFRFNPTFRAKVKALVIPTRCIRTQPVSDV